MKLDTFTFYTTTFHQIFQKFMSAETHTFQAEVKQVLDIVIHSLYTERDIFLRELISNASDALEKVNLKQVTEKDIYQAGEELQIKIAFDEEKKTITITDNGIGMTREELMTNLGTIAHSGTKALLEALKEKGDSAGEMIGQFGVGFYSAFMVSDKVELFTHSWDPKAESLKWESDGAGSYTITEESGDLDRGTSIVLHLKEDYHEYANDFKIKNVIERYSNYVGHPIILGEERVNTVEAIWLKSKSEVTAEEYEKFYQFTSKAFDAPRYTMHFQADAPMALNALLFVPQENPEKMGFGQVDPGVALHCRKVLIDGKPEGLLPEWLRFLKGVIDCADLPLNISRESLQDSSIVQKLGKVVTKRFVKFLAKQAKDDEEKYLEFYGGFQRYLKEGACHDFENKETLTELLRFQSTLTEEGKFTTLQEYIDRGKDEQGEIYYLISTSMEAAKGSLYLEPFKARGLEVLLMTDPVDEYVMGMLPEYKEKKFVSIDKADIELEDHALDGEALPEKELKTFLDWVNTGNGEQVKEVVSGTRLVDSPIIALAPDDQMGFQARAMMEAMGQPVEEPKAVIEINPRHELIKSLAACQQSDDEKARRIFTQLTQNALLAAGLVKNPAEVANGMNDLVAEFLK